MSHASVSVADLTHSIRNVPDFPKPGIQFKDITPLLADPRLLSGAIDLMTEGFKPGDVDAVVGIDARGFIFAAAAALKLKAGFIPVRKKGKLPYLTHEETYDLEYGSSTVAIHIDAVKPGARILLLDDLLATGGTMQACCKLVQGMRAQIVGITVLIELDALKGRETVREFGVVHSVLRY